MKNALLLLFVMGIILVSVAGPYLAVFGTILKSITLPI